LRTAVTFGPNQHGFQLSVLRNAQALPAFRNAFQHLSRMRLDMAYGFYVVQIHRIFSMQTINGLFMV